MGVIEPRTLGDRVSGLMHNPVPEPVPGDN